METPRTSEPDAHFKGLGPKCFQLLRDLESNNCKEHWHAHREEWNTHIDNPLQLLINELEPQIGPLRTFRQNRDTRFSPDKSPYKTWVDVVSDYKDSRGGAGTFLRISPQNVSVAQGCLAFSPEQLKYFRKAIDDDYAGNAFVKACDNLRKAGFPVGPGYLEPLKRGPRGYPTDHARSETLCWRGAAILKTYDVAPWLHTRELLDTVVTVSGEGSPLFDWLKKFVLRPANTH